MLRWLGRKLRDLIDEMDITADFRAHRKSRKLAKLDAEQPILLHDAELGVFRYERSIRWYRQSRQLSGAEVTIYLHMDHPDTDPQLTLAAARKFLADAEAWRERMGDFAVEELFDDACVWTADADEAVPLTRETFAARLTLTSVGFCEDGTFDAFFDNDDIFWGHSIEVWGSLAAGVEYANIIG